MTAHASNTSDREALVRRGALLAWFTIAWNSVEGIAGMASGLAAGSIALVGFGVVSYVEVFAGSSSCGVSPRSDAIERWPKRPNGEPSG